MLKNGSGKTILVVDDSKVNRKTFRRVLEKNQYTCIEAANGYDAIRAVMDQKPDLVLLDVMMPDISGIDVCRRLRNDNRIGPVPIIFITGANDESTLSKAFDAGGNDFIRKPVNTIEMLKRIQAIFEHESLMNQKKQGDELRNVMAMSGTICHELNQPLQYLSGSAQLLLMDLEKNTPAYEKLAKMKAQIDRMGEITKKLTSLNGIDTRSYLGQTPMLSIDK